MKTDIDIKDELYRFIKNSALHSTLSGGLYKTSRPNDSALEDIVISVIANKNQEIQEAIVYVNIYIQDVFADNMYIENTIRLREICRMSADLFEVGSVGEARFTLDEQRVLKAKTDECVISNRLLYKQFNY